MNERVRKLRQESLDAEATISIERAVLLTEFDERCNESAVPVRRAMGFRHILNNKTIWIGDGEMIVGERGPEPKAVSTYPELCCHEPDDFNILHTREKVP